MRAGFLGWLAAAAFTLAGAAAAQPMPVAIEHVAVLPMTDGAARLSDMTVVLRDGRIATVSPSRAAVTPIGARRIDGRGKFLMPALADMHVHPANDRMLRLLTRNPNLPPGVVDTADEFLPYVANGVLQILNMGAMTESVGQRAEIESGRALGPHMALAAIVDADPPAWPEGLSHVAPDPAAGRQVVRDLKADGFDFVKTYSGLSLETFSAVVDEARHRGMKALGHIPGRGAGRTAAYFQPGFTMVAHAEEFALQGTAGTPGAMCTRNGCTASLDDIPRFVAMAKANGTWLTSTLTLDDRILQQMRDPDALKNRPEIAYFNPAELPFWMHGGYAGAAPERIARQRQVVAFNARLVRAFVDAGVPVLPGTDSGVPGVMPGFALHDELEALQRAGLTPAQILVADTRLSAEWLGVQADRGTVEPGKRADLILLDADPLADVANTRRIAEVFVGGRPLSRAELDRRLKSLAARYAGRGP